MAYTIIDGIEAIVSEVDQYLQLNDISRADLSRVWGHINDKYASYEKWICYHNYTDIPLALLGEIDAVIKDDCIETRLKPGYFIDSDTLDVVPITEENFDAFAAYHSVRNPHWIKSELIWRNFSRWSIFALFTNNQITDYLLLAMGNPAQAEIFGVEASDDTNCKALITSAAKHAFKHGKKEVLYMAEENTMAHAAAISLGFANTGWYKGYQIKPNI